MDADSRISIIFILILLILAALFAVAETAFASASQSKLKVSADRGDERAERAVNILDNIESAISTLLICTNIVHLTIATVVTVMVTRLWGLGLVSVSTIITTLVVFFAGEMLPKSIAKKNPEKFALHTAGLLSVMMKIFDPLARLLTWIGLQAAKLTKGEPEISVTEDELLDIFEDLAEEGVLDDDQEDMMSSVLEFTDTKTGRILTPKKKIIGIDVNMSKEEIFELINTLNHSRVVVYDGVIDNVLGILRIREYLKEYLKTREIPDVRDIMDEPYYVSSKTMADELLEEMSRARQNIALVKGVNGKFIGLVSIEDILEELVGDIFDESDEEGGQL
ncbi:MAG: HlyC/CorC family transporter [Firmicutes bacterium]|nr:HlyC/CorC family transporter [Bacillota bacterium]MCR4709679.1 hemolysin family protein [Clostridiales bacterium]